MGDFIMRGYFKKQGGVVNSQWQERYFVLTKQELHYYLSEQHVNSQGMINLAGATVANTTKKPGLFTFEIQSSGRKYAFRMNSSEHLTSWLEAIQTAINSGSEEDDIQEVSQDNIREKLREEVLTKFNGMGGALLLERFKAGEAEGSKVLDKKITVTIGLDDVSSVELDESKFDDPTFPQAPKIRPAITLQNDQETLNALLDHFKSLASDSVVDARITKQFNVRGGLVENLLYDKSKCNKSDLRRKLGELFGGVFAMPLHISLNLDRMKSKISDIDGGVAPASNNVAADNQPNPEPDQQQDVPMISLEKQPEADKPSINLGKDPEDGPSISLDKAPEDGPMINLDKQPEPEDGPSISLDKIPEDGPSISLDKVPEDRPSISLDKQEETGISLDKTEE